MTTNKPRIDNKSGSKKISEILENPIADLNSVLVIGQRISTVETPVKYLIGRVPQVVWIQWTNNWLTNAPPSEIVFYEKGQEVCKRALLTIMPPKWLVLPLMPITYFITLASFVQAARLLGKFDLCLGVTTFPGFVGVILKRLGIVKHSVFMNCDYFPVRPWNIYSLVIVISNWMVKYAANRSDADWYVTSRILEKQELEGMVKNISIPRFIVPEGIKSEDIVESKEYNDNQIVFIGQVGPHQGLQLVVEAMITIREVIPDVSFVVIGSGPYEKTLRKMVSEHKLESVIKMTGYVQREKANALLSASAVAVAPYAPDPYSFTNYSLPGKIMLYLSFGLPVIVTNVPPIADTIQERHAGIMIEYDAKQLADALMVLFGDPQKLREYRESAITLGREYDADRIYEKAFVDTLHAIDM